MLAPPKGGKANDELIIILAEYFSVKRKSISLIAGEKGRNKIMEIDFGE